MVEMKAVWMDAPSVVLWAAMKADSLDDKKAVMTDVEMDAWMVETTVVALGVPMVEMKAVWMDAPSVVVRAAMKADSLDHKKAVMTDIEMAAWMVETTVAALGVSMVEMKAVWLDAPSVVQ